MAYLNLEIKKHHTLPKTTYAFAKYFLIYNTYLLFINIYLLFLRHHFNLFKICQKQTTSYL